MLKKDIVLGILDQEKADAFIFISEVNRFWYSGFQSSFGYLVITKNSVDLFLDGRYIENAKKNINNSDINIFLYKGLNSILESLKSKNIINILVEQEFFLYSDYLYFSNFFTKIIPYSTQKIRIVKDKEEIKNLKKAATIACQAMEWIQENIKIGMTEKHVALLVTSKMMELGASKNSFDPIIASGVNGSFPHHKSSNKKIANNEFVTIDMGCIYNGYCSDLTRTFPIGKPNKRLLDAYNTVLKSNSEGIKAAREGIIGSELDKICRDIISNTEFKDYFNHSTGHGVGIEVHELPNVTSSYKDPLPSNSIVTIEPGIYIPNLGGIRIEDMVLINQNKPITLTKLAKKYINR